MPPKAHSILSASSSHHWLNCPPSARLCETYEDKGSNYAAEGVPEQIDLIKKAILARAFRGELGTNDPNEESAVELLFSNI